MAEIITGYLIVRSPKYNFDLDGRNYFRHEPPCINQICYGGVDRMRWFEIEDSYHQHKLSSETKNLWEEIQKENRDFTGITICSSIRIAENLLKVSNHINQMNELIVIQSELLYDIKGKIEHELPSISWLGFDPVSLGNWSLLSEGVFAVPNSFQEWKNKLNEFGLFSNSEDATEYAEIYLRESKDGNVEELPESPYGITPIRIGALLQ